VTETGRDSDAIRLGNSSSPRRLRQILRTIHDLVAQAVADRLRTRSSSGSARPGPARPGRSDGTGSRPGASQPAALRPAANVGWFLGRVEAGFESSWGEEVTWTWRFWTKYESIWARVEDNLVRSRPIPTPPTAGVCNSGFCSQERGCVTLLGSRCNLGQ
jgi:hypothetical protein